MYLQAFIPLAVQVPAYLHLYFTEYDKPIPVLGFTPH
jgi:hypothetical protein